MAAQALLVVDRSEAVIQAGQPPTQMAAYILDIPDGSDAVSTAAAFAQTAGFPLGTTARIIDLSTTTVSMFQLSSNWTPVAS